MNFNPSRQPSRPLRERFPAPGEAPRFQFQGASTMSSHDCRITGVLPLKEGVTDRQIKAVLKGFLAEHGLSYAHEASAGNIEIDNRSLSLSLDIYGHGGYANESVDALAESLERIVDESGHFEFLDFDTG